MHYAVFSIFLVWKFSFLKRSSFPVTAVHFLAYTRKLAGYSETAGRKLGEFAFFSHLYWTYDIFIVLVETLRDAHPRGNKKAHHREPPGHSTHQLTATSSPPEYIKHNIVTICIQIMLRCMRFQHLNIYTYTLYLLQSVQPDDGHLRAETCSCQ